MTRDGNLIPTIEQVREDPAQRHAPYAEALVHYADAEPLRLMTPGHGGTASGSARRLNGLFGEQMVRLDIPSMLRGIDSGAESPLAQAQQLAAAAWGARRTWFMTNGATQANRTAAFAVRAVGERVLLQRSAHSSFYDGIVLAGLIPRFVYPSIDHRHGIAHGITAEAVDRALQDAADRGEPIQSVYIVSPSYFGAVSDVAAIAEATHRHGAVLIVDGAWGAHFGFHRDLPESPVRLGADLVISSTHKLGGSLSQSAMLHLGADEFARRLEEQVQRAIHLTASTSPSAILTASLDVARQSLVASVHEIGESVAAARHLRDRIREDDRLGLIDEQFGTFADVVNSDVLRIPIDVSKLGQSGHWVRDRLAEDHGVFLEISTATSVVGVIGAGKYLDVDRVWDALVAVADDAGRLTPRAVVFPRLPPPGPQRFPPREAYFRANEVVRAEDAVGRISADSLAAYPPGIPNVLPGEEITREVIEFLQAVAASPTGVVRGALAAEVDAFRVIRD